MSMLLVASWLAKGVMVFAVLQNMVITNWENRKVDMQLDKLIEMAKNYKMTK